MLSWVLSETHTHIDTNTQTLDTTTNINFVVTSVEDPTLRCLPHPVVGPLTPVTTGTSDERGTDRIRGEKRDGGPPHPVRKSQITPVEDTLNFPIVLRLSGLPLDYLNRDRSHRVDSGPG